MISHALTIVRNELNHHLATFGGSSAQAALGNVAEVVRDQDSGNQLLISVVNITEERSLKNLPAHRIDQLTGRVHYQNPPTYLNLAVLVTATHKDYTDALTTLSRAMTFFQFANVFTPETVNPQSISEGAPVSEHDRLADFRLVLNLWSPTFEEVNDMWGMLGGKQYPFALYSMRMLELRFEAPQREGGLITEVVSNFTVTREVG